MTPLPTDRRTTRELAAKKETFSATARPAQWRAIENLIQSLVDEGIAANALRRTDSAPDFILPTGCGQTLRLYSQLDRGPVVLVFYRGGWCGFCETYLRGLQREIFYIRELGAELIAVSPQLPDPSLQFESDCALQFPVLSDVGLKVTQKFGLTYDLPAKTRKTYREFGYDLAAVNGGGAPYRLPLAATFVIRPDRTIQVAAIDEDPAQRLDPIDVLEALVEVKSTRPARTH